MNNVFYQNKRTGRLHCGQLGENGQVLTDERCQKDQIKAVEWIEESEALNLIRNGSLTCRFCF